MITIIGVGDIMPGGVLTDSGKNCANNEVLELLSKGDLRCGTFECAFGNEPTYDEEKVKDGGNTIYAKDADVRRLKELHVDVVSLANNHFFDLGNEGALHTIELLDKEGIMHCGAGRNLKEAGEPAIMDIKGERIAFLGFCDTNYRHVLRCTYATENSPGINPMQKDYVVNEIKKCKALYDKVIVLAHWGSEHTFCPNVSTINMARIMIESGACLVLGSHPHRVQPVINTAKGSVAYSMGNFLFPERLIAPPRVTYYPTEPIDYSTLPFTENYPLVKRVTYKSLPFLARVGLIVTSIIDDHSVKSSYMFSYLNNENCLEILDDKRSKKIKKTITRVEKHMRRSYYPFYFKFSRYKGSFLSKVRALMNKTQKHKNID